MTAEGGEYEGHCSSDGNLLQVAADWSAAASHLYSHAARVESGMQEGRLSLQECILEFRASLNISWVDEVLQPDVQDVIHPEGTGCLIAIT